MGKNKNILLEIGCEEIPARFMPGLLDDLKNKSAQELKSFRIDYSKIETFGTYRRLVLSVESVSNKQSDIIGEQKGPSAEIAFQDGKPTQAALGFANSVGVSTKDLVIKPFGERNYVFAKIKKLGKPTKMVLRELFPNLIKSLYLPLSMRWGDGDFRFIRPIHSLLALYGKQIVRFELAGVRSGKLQSAELTVFKSKLLKAGVILDQEERKKEIVRQVKKLAPNALIEEDLLDEVNYLVENPITLWGKFDPKYLKLPKEVLITSMKKNQKYFPTLSGDELQSDFVVVTDGAEKKYHKNIRAGNEKVLSARLEDARFFFEEDQKVPLKDRVKDLEKVAFFEKLGNMREKIERIRQLAGLIAKRLKLDGPVLQAVDQVAFLCKSDLTTQMVFEFPVLQGVMGREYEGGEVGQGIFEHYLPRFPGDTLPKSAAGAIVSLADKLDTIVGCFSLGYQPTGSADPHGLRRAVYGIVAVIEKMNFSLNLDELIEYAHKLYAPILEKEESYNKPEQVQNSILSFISARIKNVLLEKKTRHDFVDAVLGNFNDIQDLFLRVEALNRSVSEAWFDGIRRSADRVAKISGSVAREQVKEHDLEEEVEKELYNLYLKVNWEVEEKINQNSYSEALFKLSILTPVIDNFFDKILVMHQDERLKVNRLALLKTISNLYLRIADFTLLKSA